MTQVKRTLKDMRLFCRLNGYLFAAYKRVTDYTSWPEWLLQDTNADNDEDTYPDDMVIECNVTGSQSSYVSYCETQSEDKEFVFRLHNNYNLPNVIPCF